MDESVNGELFGGHSITEELFKYIRSVLPDGGTLLELGSGRITELFTEHYKVYSVENDPFWVDTTESTYIYAPLVDDKWYDTEILKRELPEKYDLLLVDGPRTQERRANIINNLDLFRDDCIWLFDDVNQPGNLATFDKIVEITGRRGDKVQMGTKLAGILYPNT